MEGTLVESICYYLGLDYHQYVQFTHNWLTLRGLTSRLSINVPPAPRLHIAIPIGDRASLYRLDIDTDALSSSVDEVDIDIGGFLTPDSVLSSDIDLSDFRKDVERNGRYHDVNTPDIVRTIQRAKGVVVDDGTLSFMGVAVEDEDDCGFCSDYSHLPCDHSAQRRIDSLQRQFDRLQRDLALLVERQTAVVSAPSVSLVAAPPPPPCAPPPPPTVSTPLVFRHAPSARPALPGTHSSLMDDVLKGLSSVTLRPTPQRCPRVATHQESVIATALRQRFLRVRLLNQSQSSQDENDSDHSQTTLLGRSLLRKVDRADLPAVVSRDFDQ